MQLLVHLLRHELPGIEILELTPAQYPDVYALLQQNPDSMPTDLIGPLSGEADMEGEAPRKCFLGFYRQHRLCALADLTLGYPQRGVLWIGYFMVDAALRRQGIGSAILSRFIFAATLYGIPSLQLCVDSGDTASRVFWQTIGFEEICSVFGNNVSGETYSCIVMEQQL